MKYYSLWLVIAFLIGMQITTYTKIDKLNTALSLQGDLLVVIGTVVADEHLKDINANN